jgi:outer membrane protein OmpA-like peptidoglycan-associated protein
VLRAREHIDIAVAQAQLAYKNSQGCAVGDATVVITDKDPDKDGLIFPDDKCVTIAGPKENSGCPYGDTDGDGINDKNDACPASPEDKDGDRDADGRPDVDADSDGVEDCVGGCPAPDGELACDTCANAAEDKDGFEDNDGCPESDNDKDTVPDLSDACPNIAGAVANKGCPDADGDGIIDPDDMCKDEKGIDQKATKPERHGCPADDTDKDGIMDSEDKCPTEPGILQPDNPEKNGCPKKYKLIEIRAEKIVIKQQVQFDTNKATIKPASAKLLAEVGEAIRSSKLTRVTIDGHTDDVGDGETNQTLSDERARSVLRWLVDKEGVNEKLLLAVGHGEEEPIASNRTKQGRQLNRRVEFNVTR